MIQVLEHNYGKGRVTRRQIRAAIKAVRAADAETVTKAVARKAAQKPTPAKSTKGK
jgi:hypothetical protein